MNSYISNRELDEPGDGLVRCFLERVISKMAAQIGVSYTAMLIRLRQFNLLEYHLIEEYLDMTVPGGTV